MKTLADYQSNYGKAHYPWENKPTPEPKPEPEVEWQDTHDLNKSAKQVLEETWVEMNIPEVKRQEMREGLPFMNWITKNY